MAAQLALSSADVVTPAGTLEKVRVRVRLGTATLSRNAETVATMGGVSAVVPVSRKVWRIVGPDGEWEVTKRAGCGCGGR